MKLIQRGICLCRWGGGNGGEMDDDHCRDNGGDSDAHNVCMSSLGLPNKVPANGVA